MEYQVAAEQKLVLPSLCNQGWARESGIRKHAADSNSNVNGQMVQALLQLGAQSPTFSGFSDLKQPYMLRNMLSSSPKLEGASVRSRSPKTSVSPARTQPNAQAPFIGKRTPLATDSAKRAFESYPWETQAGDPHPARARQAVGFSPLMFEQPGLSRHRSDHPEDGFPARPTPSGRKRELIIRVSLEDADDGNNPLKPANSPFGTPIGALLRYAAAAMLPGRLDERKAYGENSGKRKSATNTPGFEPHSAKEYIRHCIAKEQKFNKRVQNIETYFDERKDGLLKLLDDL